MLMFKRTATGEWCPIVVPKEASVSQDYGAIVTGFTPLVIELINEFRHRNDEPTEAEIAGRLAAKLAYGKATGAAWLQTHPEPPPGGQS